MIETDNIGFRCRSCYSERGSIVLDLGVQPLANNLLNESDLNSKEPKFPLRLAVCNNCHLMQIVDLVPPVKLFTEYFYFSSFSDTMVEHARRAAERYIKEFNLTDKSFVIEIASNDGYLLRNFVAAKIPCLGIEPAKNVADVAIRQGIPTVVEFFGEPYARKLVDEGKQVSFSVDVNGSIPWWIQWYKNGQPVDGATNLTFSFIASAMDNGATIYAVATNRYTNVVF
ncbi:MAG: hypothetical protein ACP5K7_13805, partial [Verrucomicrobiia bacterium]